MSSNIAIRAASRDDATDLARLLSTLGYQTSPEETIARLGRLEATGLDQALVAEDDDSVVGLIGLHITPVLLQSAGPVAQITVLAATKQDVARQLVAAVERLAGQAGCATIAAQSAPASSALYEALGYEQTPNSFRKEL